MYTILIAAILVFVMSFLYDRRDCKDNGWNFHWLQGAIFGLMMSFIGALVAALLLFIISAIVGEKLPAEVNTSRQEILIMSDTVGTEGSGSFSLGSGWTVTRQGGNFGFYTRGHKDEIKFKVVESDSSTIFDDVENPYIIERCEEDGGVSLGDWYFTQQEYGDGCSYEFHIPKGSITEKVELDAK